MIIRIIILAFLAAALFAVSGCDTKPRIVVESHTVVISPTAVMTTPAPVPKPSFTPQEFSVAKDEERSALLLDLNERLSYALKLANQRLTAIPVWVKLQIKNIEDKKEVKNE